MGLENLRVRELTFKDTFIYMKAILLLNFLNFLKIFICWAVFAFLLSFLIKFFNEYFVVLSVILAYTFFYLLYLTSIRQTRFVIDNEKQSVFACFKQVSNGFLSRKGLDLLELIPALLVIFLVVFFPSSVFAIPFAFVVTLVTLILAAYAILVQPVVVIKKIAIIPAVRYSASLISGYLTFVIGLILTLAIACLLLYIPFIFIHLSSAWHYALVLSVIGIEALLFAIMLTVVYTNLEVAWSVGFKTYNTANVVTYKEDNNHEFTEFFNTIPEVKISEESTDDFKNKK